MTGINMLAGALDRFTEAYEARTACERDRLAFEMERDKAIRAEKAAQAERERVRLATKAKGK